MSIVLHPVRRWLAAAAAASLVFILVASGGARWEISLLAGWDAGLLACLATAAAATYLLLMPGRITRATGPASAAEPVTPVTLAAVTIIAALGSIPFRYDSQ